MNAPNEFPLDTQIRRDHEEQHIEDRFDELDPTKISRILFWGITVFFVILFLWAAFAEIDRTVRGQGRVISSSQLQVVTSLEGGVLEDILVQPGERVEAGEVLVRLDPTQSGAELGSSSATAVALDMKIARLRAEVAGQAPSYPMPSTTDAASQLQVEKSLYSSRQAALRSALSAGQAQIERARQGVAQAQATVQARQSALAQAQNEVNAVRPLVDNGIEPRMTLTRAESQAATAQSDLASARAGISQASAQVAEASANLARIRQDWREQSANELALAQADYEARASTLPALQKRVDRTTLRAPTSGQVSRVLVTTRGSAVSPGEPVVELVSDDDRLMVEARVRPQDIGSVRIGQKAKVGITAYDQAVYGTLDGQVQTISPDSIVDPQTGETYYLVRVTTQANGLRGPSGQELEIGPGMVADISLLGDKRTVLQYILTPITRLSETAFRE